MQSRIRKAPKIYFSFRSPFSWLGIEAALRRRPELISTCAWIPYFDPSAATSAALAAAGGSFHYVQMSKAKHLYILQDAKRLCDKYGEQMSWPVDIAPVWEVPHLAWLAAEPEQRYDVYRSIVAMRWGLGADICDPELLAERLAADGVDPSLAQAHTVPEIQQQAVGCLYEAYNDDVFGIPYFKSGSHRYWGLDRVDWFLAGYDHWRNNGTHGVVIPPANAEIFSPPRELASVGLDVALDTDSPGGCG